MNPHHRLRAVRADRRTTTSRCRTVMAAALTVLLLTTACGSERAADSALPTPPVSQGADGPRDSQGADGPRDSQGADGPRDSQRSDDIISETVGAMGAFGTDDIADYTEAELEVLLDVDEPDEGLDAPNPEPLDTGTPDVAIEAVEDRLQPPKANGGTPILDRIDPVDDGLTGTIFGIRDGRRINEVGEANRLDEAAALACGNVEIALTALDDGRPDDAADHLQSASTSAADTSVPAMTEWASILDQAAAAVVLDGSAANDPASLIAFLTTCTQGGYEL